MNVREVPFSELQNRGKAAVSEWLASEGGRPLRVTRRDAEDLVLMTAARADQEHEVVSAAAAVLRALTAKPGVFRSALVSAFAWARLLSDAEIDQFALELADALNVGAALDNPAPSAQTIEAWRHTAEVYADPDLARILRAATNDDGGAVPAPSL